MIKNIVKDSLFLSLPSENADEKDKAVITDLKDTLRAHREHCVGMAGNMIGARKRILIFDAGFVPVIMVNPVILSRKGPYETSEGCLSLAGERKTTRWKEIEVEYLDESFRKKRNVFRDFTAQIIQHEMDHFDGKLI